VDVDTLIQSVSSKKEEWTKVPIPKKLEYLLQMREVVELIAPEWAELSAKVRNYDTPYLKGVGWIMSVGIFGGTLAPLIDSYTELVQYKRPLPPVSVRKVGDQEVVSVFPYRGIQKVGSMGMSAELWIAPGHSVEQKLPEEPGLCAILGAGNFDGPLECLRKLFVENKTIVYKPNPVNQNAVTPVFGKIFAKLIQDGFVGFLEGGAEVGASLVNHPLVDEILMTGGAGTYDKIVWGNSKEEQEQNKKNNKKLVQKKIDAELGSVSPWIIVPGGEWTESEINHHAELLVTSKIMNSSALCASPQLLIVDNDWPHKRQFIDAVKKKFSLLQSQPNFYPGTNDRCSKFKSSLSQAEQYEKSGQNVVSPVFIPDAPRDSLPVKEEAFAPVLAEIALNTKNDPTVFLKEVVEYCNNEVYGSLSLSIMIDPNTEAKFKTQLEDAIAKLEWGTIAINEWAGYVHTIGVLTWGAFPKHDPTNIQSGQGKIGNVGMYLHPQKSVLRNQFMALGHFKLPSPADAKVFIRLVKYILNPSWARVFGLMGAALLGI